MRRHPVSIGAGAACFLAAVLVGTAMAQAAGSAPDWSRYADVEEIVSLTEDEDGAVRETTIWLVVVDGQGYIRTGNTNWGDNVVRNQSIAIRVEGEEIPVQVRFIEDEALRERIVAAFREKYGWSDGLINFIRGSHPKIMRLDSR
jgi:hypothetical protein